MTTPRLPRSSTSPPAAWLAGWVRLIAPVLCATLLVAPAANAQGPALADGPVSVTLPACGQSSPLSEVRVPGCSYVALPKKDGGVYYAHLASAGDIRMDGSASSGRLTLPAAGQKWPDIQLPGGFATVDVKKATITGTVDPAGSVQLSVPFEATIRAEILGSCMVKGAAAVSSAGTDPIGGGQGRALDPDLHGFAAAGTSTPVLQGALCARVADYLDLTHGVGWYVDGTIAATAATRAQTVSVELPKRIKRKGRTVLLKRPVVTSADQTVTPVVKWGTSKPVRGTKGKWARLTVRKGKVTIRTTGEAKRLYVRLSLRAPAAPGYRAFTSTRVWVVK